MRGKGERPLNVKRKAEPGPGPWDIAAGVMAGLLFVDLLSFFILLVVGVDLLLVYALEMGVVTAVFLLLGIGLYFAGQTKFGKLWKRLLLGALFSGGAMMVFFTLGLLAIIAFGSSL